LRKFCDHHLYEKYDRLIIYVLTERQRSYADTSHKNILRDKLKFDVKDDIWDYRNILAKTAHFDITKVLKVERILEANFGEGNLPLFLGPNDQLTESVCLNLLELSFPKTLYLANLANDDTQDSKRPKRRRKYKTYSPRDLVKKALLQKQLRFGVDWEYHENKIITFHNLNDETLPITQIIDEGTVDRLSPEEFYGINENYEKVFKSLLGRCLQQKLYHQRVLWQHEDKLFIFSDLDGAPIRSEQWYGQRESDRVVYERVMKTKKPSEVFYCKHLAFTTQYKRFVDSWYLLIKPEWFFSYDGYKRSFYASDRIDWLKKQEDNSQVLNHLRFIVYFLTHDKPPELFVERRPYPFLSFGELVSFDSAPSLDDLEWNPAHPKDDEESRQIPIFDQ